MSDQAVEARDRFFAHFPRTDDLSLLVLKAHLLVEEQLNALLASLMPSPEELEDARLTFHQRLALARALGKTLNAPKFWEALGALNRLRNQLAHSLDPPKLEARLDRFLELVSDARFGPVTPPKLPSAHAEAIPLATLFLHAQLAAMRDTVHQQRPDT